MQTSTRYINVILPLPLASVFTYVLPVEWAEKVRVGMRVLVPFGKKKMHTAIVESFCSHAPETYEAKEIFCILDEKPILRHPQLQFWQWLQAYYCANAGDVFQAAVPAGLKLQSETKVCINPDFNPVTSLSEKEIAVLDALSEGKTLAIADLVKMLDFKSIMPVLKNLMEKGAVETSEELVEKFREKRETFVKLSDEMHEGDNLAKIFDKLENSKIYEKQLRLLMTFIEMSRCLSVKPLEVSRKILLQKADVDSTVLNALAKKSVLEIYEKTVSRLDLGEIRTEPMFPLSEAQQAAYISVNQQFAEKNVVLLHGVTSSGKTEIYIHLIQKCLNEGKQALFLVPEIALTTQLTTRLRRIFGNKLGVYHSKFSDAERVEIWNNLLNDSGYEIIIGVRSSVFLPFRKLGLVIVDEEHETSYKQFDHAPRYHARNAAIVLAQMHGAKTLLGTATPSLESYYNAKSEKYGLVELFVRHEAMQLPEILTVDTKEAYHKKQMNGHFSDVLLEKMTAALTRNEQIILFQNRRGYAPFLECKTCACVPKCKNCDVSLTVHKYFNTLTCHYCGYTEPIPAVCPACKTPATLQSKGFGTEKIEDEIRQLFPEKNVGRMDLDTTRTRKNYEKILEDFEQGKIDILVGTQMISKGLDFERVSLVGVLNADNLMNFPDFRASERAFQMLVQVGGRAGRKHRRGTVVLQTSQPKHAVLGQVISNDYAAMFKTQCAERQAFHYPPFFRLIQVAVRHRDTKMVHRAAQKLAADMRSVFGQRVLGPNDPLVARVQNVYIKHILLKLENAVPPEKAKTILLEQITQLLSNEQFKSVWVNLDIDPM